MVKIVRLTSLLLFFWMMGSLYNTLSSQTVTSVSGIVKDSITGEPLSYVSVLFKNSTIGAMTDDNGAFSLQNDKGYTTLVVSSMGYTEKEIQLKAGKNNAALAIMLRPTSYELTEVVVKPKREKYSRKNNPAVELIKKVIEHKDDNRIEAKDEYQVESYEKLSLALDNFSPNLDSKLGKKFSFIKNYLDTSEFNGKPILTLSVRETLADRYCPEDGTKDPAGHRGGAPRRR